MLKNSLFGAAAIVGAIAVLVAMFLDLPMLLTAEDVNVNAGLIISAIAAIGTVGTLLWAVLNGLAVRREADADRRAATAEKQLEQARRVCGWVTSLGSQPMGSPSPNAQRVRLSNSSQEPVHGLVAYLLWVQGHGASTGEAMQRSGQEAPRMRAMVQILPPGNFQLTLSGPLDTPMQGRLGLEVAFTDSAGRHWVRRVPSGQLERLATPPIDYYAVERPLPPYHDPEPWRP